MDKVLSTALLTIVGVITAAMLASALIPTVSRSLGTMAVTTSVIEKRLQTDLAFEYVVQNTSSNTLLAWVKNTGTTDIAPVTQVDLILTGSSTYLRIPYGNGAGQWQYSLDGSTWSPGTTASITVNQLTLTSGQYQFTLITPNGISVGKTFNV